ncbi:MULTISPECIES: pectinesterase family protein [unclassified Actinotalea]|uniref:pectinesterase family protein n=1 Tax=unclassified Actinotalea TaxID=2638618 RepID=UPI001C7102CB|nr:MULTISPECIES: pectinesterase family protein [unclassified Actinotalea]
MAKTARVGDDVDLLPALAAALADPDVTEVVLEPGTYVEQVVIAPRAAPLTVRSATGRAQDVRITWGLRQGDRGRDGLPIVQDCATVTVDADDVTIEHLTIENTFDRTADPGLEDTQALALRTRGDRVRLRGCALLGRQDTVLLDAPGWSDTRHVHLVDCLVVGDVDVVYGRARAVVEGGEIRSVGPGWVAAPSTARENTRGFLFRGVRLTGPGLPDGSVRLGRPWHPGGKADAVGEALFVDCVMGPHIAADAWSPMGGFAWEDARFGEHGSTGPGAHEGPGRPRLRPEAVPGVAEVLGGWTDAAPGPAPLSGRAVVVSDSTASPYGPARAPRTGWGEMLADATGLRVENLAVSGASSVSFIASGQMDAALAVTGPGDLLLIAFGHNDEKPDERGTLPWSTYPAALSRYVVGARARGAVPVLITPVERRRFVDGRARSSHGGYPQAVRRLAEEDGVALVDLTASSRRLWQRMGEEGSKAAFLWLEPGAWPAFPDGEQDDTHLSDHGARLVADLLAAGLRSLGLVPGGDGVRG